MLRGSYRLSKIEHLINLVKQDDQGRGYEQQGGKEAHPETLVHLKTPVDYVDIYCCFYR